MVVSDVFSNLTLQNRLGQSVQLAVYHAKAFGREYVFVKSLVNHASSVVAKNAEHFAFQLRELFNSDARRFEMVEVRGESNMHTLHRWRFEWVGASPITPRCELIASENQQIQLFQLLTSRNLDQAAC